MPFKKSDDWSRNASIGKCGHGRLIMMMTGYKSAADLMVEKSRESNYDRDCLVFPILFNYRQFIELSLKYLISTYGYTVSIEANWKSHDLAFLWSEFLKILDAYGADDPDQTNPVVGAIVAEFSKVDPRSYSYRYPVDLNGNLIPITYEELDLEALADVMEGVGAYFSGCDGYLSSLQEPIPSVETQNVPE
ncbi:hypothetical protein [Phreatobacter stygius]|uniref:hypothetical protein n=1 Tax=Phreatobacter stygius TaxID=1940610 RepID=UPI001FE50EE3|nr:hypothetical protein [Phreatobacter stygius]